MLLLFNEVLGKGFDARNFINGYAAHLRDLMVCKDPETVQLMEVGAGIREKYLAQSQQVPLPFLYEGLDICNQADIQFRSSRNQRLTIELALVKLANLTEGQKKKQLAEPPSLASASGEKKDPSLSAESAVIPEEHDPAENDNGIIRTVYKPSISIKDSLSKEMGSPSSTFSTLGEEDLDEEIGTELVEQIPCDPDSVLKAWNAYAASIEKDKPRVFSTLQNNRPVVSEEGIIRVLLNTEAQSDNFQRNIKGELSSYIREATGNPRIEIITEVVEQASEGKRIYTDQDRLEHMLKVNPELARLKSRFGLDFDD